MEAGGMTEREDEEGRVRCFLPSGSPAKELKDEERKTILCRICHEEEQEEDEGGALSSPDRCCRRELIRACRCDGSLRYVHESCLLPWILDYDHRECEICRHVYSVSRSFLPLRSWHWPDLGGDASCGYFLLSLSCKLLFVLSNWYGFFVNFRLLGSWDGGRQREQVCPAAGVRSHLLHWMIFHKALTLVVFFLLHTEWKVIRRDLLSELAAWFLIGTSLGATALKQLFLTAHLAVESLGPPWHSFGACLSSVIQAEALLNWPVFLIIIVDTSVAPWVRAFLKQMKVTRVRPFEGSDGSPPV